jgi:hypothetical protein
MSANLSFLRVDCVTLTEPLSRLGEIGVDFAQGYAIGIPRPLRST